MPGMGLTGIGLAGLVISYAGIAKTFVDGMHALTGLTMFIGLIFLATGILEGGVSTSNKAKATTLVVLGIGLSFGVFAITMTTISTLPIIAGVLFAIAAPAIIISYVAMKMPQYAKAVSIIFVLAIGTGLITYTVFGFQGPEPMFSFEPSIEEVIEEIIEVSPATNVVPIEILAGSSEQGNPDYSPDSTTVSQGDVIEWTNNDELVHTVTSSIDFGETFDSSLISAGNKFQLDTGSLDVGEYEYMCTVHPWMIATFVIQEPSEPVTESVSIPEGAGVQQIGQLYFDPKDIAVTVGTTIIWANEDSSIHTVTSGTPEDGPSGDFDSDILGVAESFEHTFNSAGTTEYYCVVHPWMTGRVTVE